MTSNTKERALGLLDELMSNRNNDFVEDGEEITQYCDAILGYLKMKRDSNVDGANAIYEEWNWFVMGLALGMNMLEVGEISIIAPIEANIGIIESTKKWIEENA